MNNQQIDSPHDLMARNYFSQPSAMANFLREFLPTDMYNALDMASLDPGKESYISENLKESIADLVFHCKLKNGHQGSVYVLFEHKHQPAPICALQMLRYMSMIWDEEVRNGHYKENGSRLSFIIPVVFYHGKRKWNGKQMRELFPKNPALSACIPDFQMIVSNLREVSPDKLQSNLVPNGMLLMLQALLSDNPLQEIANIVSALLLANKPEARQDVEIFLTYLPRTKTKFSNKELIETIEGITMRQGMTITSSTFGEYWFPEYFHKVVGEGRAEGENSEVRRSLREMIEARFGFLPEDIQSYIANSTNMDYLRSLRCSLFKVNSLQEFKELLKAPQ